MNGKQYVTDADLAKAIASECQTGDAEWNRQRAGEILCQVLGSRDYDKTVAAFKAVAERAPALAPSDRAAAAKLKKQLDGLYEETRKRDITELHIIIEETIERALSAARGDESKYQREERMHTEILISDLQTENERLRKEVRALADAAREDNAALALCWDTFSRRITLDRRRECLTALQSVKADEVFYQEYEGDRKKVIAAQLEGK